MNLFCAPRAIPTLQHPSRAACQPAQAGIPQLHSLQRTRLAASLHAVVLSLSVGAAAPVAAQVQAQQQAATGQGAEVRRFDVPAGPLDAALGRFARAAGVNLSYEAAALAGVASKGLRGDFTVWAGLSALLVGSGLEAVAQPGGGYVLRKGAAPAVSATKAVSAATEAVLPVVTVKAGAERESATGPVAGYVAKRSATATKTDTPIVETPQSVTVVTAEEIETRKAKDVLEAFSYAAGVFANTASGNRVNDDLRLRGFDAGYTTFRDGMKYNGNAYFDGQQELYGLERVELLRGAASVLYGTAEPGGLLNTVSKRPRPEPLHEINMEGTSRNLSHPEGA